MEKNIKNIKNRVFFVGIGGISMSALAKLTISTGGVVAGSDAVQNQQTESLKSVCKVFIGHDLNNIKLFRPDLVVYSGAIKSDNSELVYAQQSGIKIMERSEYLALICKQYENVIAIAGTHGKTTTTAMIAQIFRCANLNPTIHVGGVCLNFDSNVVVGDNKYFITEACEYKKSFEYIQSSLGVVTNIECDHMDCYQDFDDLKHSFAKFLDNSKMCMVENDNSVLNQITTKIIYTFGENNANYVAKNLKITQFGLCFDVYENDKILANFRLNVMGEYNVKNALVAIGVARVYGIDITSIYDGLNSFLGVQRRNENLGRIGKTVVYADYCHHPTEIKNSIANFLYHFNRVLCIFQPHTYSRTVALMREFSKCFKGVKKLIIFKTYPAREKFNFLGSETNLFKHINLKNKELIVDRTQLIDRLNKISENYDCVIVLGAGDVYDIVKSEIDKSES